MGGKRRGSRLPRYAVVLMAVCGLAGHAARAVERVQVDVYYDCTRAAPTKALSAAGLSVTSSVKLASLCVVEGWLAPEALSSVTLIDGVTRVEAPSYAVHPRHRPALPGAGILAAPLSDTGSMRQPAAVSGGSIDHNGVTIMRADLFISQTGMNGAGVKVGVQSAGITTLQTIQSRGELPAVQVVMPSDGATTPAGDEGTALLEEVHAVAPGAGLIYCGPNTFVEYTSCLSQLIAAGATILVDDLIFPQQDVLSADSAAVKAIEQLLTDNPTVVLFTAGGNYNGSYWEGDYAPVSLASLGLPPLTCASGATPQTDNYVLQFDGDGKELLTVMQSSRIPFAFAWADPPGRNTSKFDVYWVNDSNNTQVGCLATGGGSSTQIVQNINFTSGSYRLYIATPDATASGKFLKLWLGGDGLTSLSKSTTGSAVTPQTFAAGVVSVGAVNGSDGVGRNIEPFSSLGPITLTFPQLTHIQSPVLVAPDGINVDATGTYFEGVLFPDGNFYGTSASAPNAAGVAALIRSVFPSLTAVQLVSALESGAIQLGTASPDGTFGYGRIDALGALGILQGTGVPPPPPATPPPPASSTPPASTGSGGGGGGSLDGWMAAALLLATGLRRRTRCHSSP